MNLSLYFEKIFIMKYNNNQIIIKISYQFQLFSNLFLNKYFGIGNEIGDEGIKYLSESLKSNNSIQTLYLEGKTKKYK